MNPAEPRGASSRAGERYVLRPSARRDLDGLYEDIVSRFGQEDFDKLKQLTFDDLAKLTEDGYLWHARSKAEGRRFLGTAYVEVSAHSAEFGGAAVLPEYRGRMPGLALDLGACALASFMLNTGGLGEARPVVAHVHEENERVARLIMRRGGFEKIEEVKVDPRQHRGFQKMPVDADGLVRGSKLELTPEGRIRVLERAAKLVLVHGLEDILPLEDIEGLLVDLRSRASRR